jgi:hypothetical protein
LIGKRRSTPNRFQPVRNNNGSLATEPRDIGQIWLDHFKALSTPLSPETVEIEYWNRATNDTTTGIRREIPQVTLEETTAALSKLSTKLSPETAEIEYWNSITNETTTGIRREIPQVTLEETTFCSLQTFHKKSARARWHTEMDSSKPCQRQQCATLSNSSYLQPNTKLR